MIKALDTAAAGMLQAERRATDIAKEILQSSSDATSFKSNLSQSAGDTPTATPATTGAVTTRTPVGGTSGYSDLLQQMVDLKAEEQAFKANAKAFKRIDETLGSLLDDKS